jgi:anhydro-N-acetylmuramic acid kinase
VQETLWLGLMSGTSVDGVDSVLLQCRGDAMDLVDRREHPIPQALRQGIIDISHSGDDEIERLGVLDRQIGALFADAALALLAQSGMGADRVSAIGSHGQTVRHRPPSAGGDPHTRFTLQIGDPATIAECTGITTVADFRRRDIAAGGEGAPLAPAFHAVAFSQPGTDRAVVNIGGIANVSLLRGGELVAGFDTGPGNTLMDQWALRHLGQPCDRGGSWAAGGRIEPVLLARLMAHPYLAASGPRSTGRETFNLRWLDGHLPDHALPPQDVMATLAEFTAESIALGIERGGIDPAEIFVCGGGSRNGHLMSRLARRLAPRPVEHTGALGIDPEWVEAAAFAWLASRTMAGLPGNAPAVTGAAGPRVLGAVFSA